MYFMYIIYWVGARLSLTPMASLHTLLIAVYRILEIRFIQVILINCKIPSFIKAKQVMDINHSFIFLFWTSLCLFYFVDTFYVFFSFLEGRGSKKFMFKIKQHIFVYKIYYFNLIVFSYIKFTFKYFFYKYFFLLLSLLNLC